MADDKAISSKVIGDFGKEWKTHDQSDISPVELEKIFQDYFDIFPVELLNRKSVGADFGCGSGRWARFVVPRVKKLICVEPSIAVEVAKQNLANFQNVAFLNQTIEDMNIGEATLDFGYSLGVLHHIPDTQNAMKICVSKLKKNAPFLVYLYYNFENRSVLYRLTWRVSDVFRRAISVLPEGLKGIVTNAIALGVYYLLARFSKILSRLNVPTANLPLEYYKDVSLNTMRTDARDRFGTTLEKRFSRADIKSMMEASGLERIIFSDTLPFWCALGYKSQ